MSEMNDRGSRSNWGAVAAVIVLTVVMGYGLRPIVSSGERKIPFTPDEKLIALDQAVDWSAARLLAVQDGGRYKTLDSLARESMQAMSGAEKLPDLTPLASLLEWAFNRAKMSDARVIYLKDRGIRIHLTAHMTSEAAARVRDGGYMTQREFFDPVVEERIRELAPRTRMNAAMNRVSAARMVAGGIDDMLRIVPRPEGPEHEQWVTPQQLVPNLPESLLREMAQSASLPEMGGPVPGIASDHAMQLVLKWSNLRASWIGRDAAGVNKALAELIPLLPQSAGPEGYPSLAQRQAEAHYYAMGKFTWGWVTYYLGGIIAIWALATRWRSPWVIGLVLLVLALSLHAYGLGLRWYILGRIPVANMFEAVVASAWVGVVAGLLLELVFRTRVFLLAAHATGFMALILGSYVIPGQGTLTTIRMILDDVMLRIHTTLIISSYALIFLAAVIALVYLFGFYYHTARQRSMESGGIAMVCGVALLLMSGLIFRQVSGANDLISGYLKNPVAPVVFWTLAAACGAAIVVAIRRRAGGETLAGLGLVCTAAVSAAIGDYRFVSGVGTVMAAGGATWLALNYLGAWLARSPVALPALAGAGGPMVGGEIPIQRTERPILAGGAPGDEARRSNLPQWLLDFDWSHLIILNLVFILLFVGIVLGAMWADYSWGRPWGWDPKEVFALNTWIVYAILIHTRFVVKDRGLWTAWLSVIGCLMMAFNWCFVNFFIVGLHSYA